MNHARASLSSSPKVVRCVSGTRPTSHDCGVSRDLQSRAAHVEETATNGRGLVLFRAVAQRFGFVDNGEAGTMLLLEIERSSARAGYRFSPEAPGPDPVNPTCVELIP